MPTVHKSVETGELYVAVGGGLMLDYDYVEGGRVEDRDSVGPTALIGSFTNAQIENQEHIAAADALETRV